MDGTIFNYQSVLEKAKVKLEFSKLTSAKDAYMRQKLKKSIKKVVKKILTNLMENFAVRMYLQTNDDQAKKCNFCCLDYVLDIGQDQSPVGDIVADLEKDIKKRDNTVCDSEIEPISADISVFQKLVIYLLSCSYESRTIVILCKSHRYFLLLLQPSKFLTLSRVSACYFSPTGALQNKEIGRLVPLLQSINSPQIRARKFQDRLPHIDSQQDWFSFLPGLRVPHRVMENIGLASQENQIQLRPLHPNLQKDLLSEVFRNKKYSIEAGSLAFCAYTLNQLRKREKPATLEMYTEVIQDFVNDIKTAKSDRKIQKLWNHVTVLQRQKLGDQLEILSRIFPDVLKQAATDFEIDNERSAQMLQTPVEVSVFVKTGPEKKRVVRLSGSWSFQNSS